MSNTSPQESAFHPEVEDTTINIEQLRDILALSFKRVLLDFYIHHLQIERNSASVYALSSNSIQERRNELLQSRNMRTTGAVHVSHDDAIHHAAIRLERAAQMVTRSVQQSSKLVVLCLNHMLHKMLNSLRLLKEHMDNAIEAEDEFISRHEINALSNRVDDTSEVTPQRSTIGRILESHRTQPRLPQLTTIALECVNNLEDCLDIFDLFGLNEFDPYYRLSPTASVRWSIPNPENANDLFENFMRSPGMCMPGLLNESPPVNSMSQTSHLTSIEQATSLWVWRLSLCFLINNLLEAVQSEVGVDCFNDMETLLSFSDTETGLFSWEGLLADEAEVNLLSRVVPTSPSTYTLLSTYCRNIYAVLRACLGVRERVSLLYWIQRIITD